MGFLRDDETQRLANKLAKGTKRLLDLPADMSRGSSTGDDEVYVVERTADIEKDVLRSPVFATDLIDTPSCHRRNGE